MALVFTFVYYWLRGLINFEKSMESIPNGFIQMISPILILCFAWTLCGLCRDDGLQVGTFVEGVMANTGSLAKFLPAVIFIVACFIGFATGTSWGTIGIMVPLVCAVFDWDTQMTSAVRGSGCFLRRRRAATTCPPSPIPPSWLLPVPTAST